MQEEKDIVKLPFIKIFADIFLSFLLIITVSPLYLIIIFSLFFERILLGKPFSPVFYIEKRISAGKTFNFVKFNIFKPGVIEGMRERGEFIHTKPLERERKNVTTIGNLVQKSYMDELPQLFAILFGHISFVGPRPVNLEVYQDLLERKIYTKTVIKTGLTGPYQSKKGMGDKKSDVQMDNEYIEYCRSHNGIEILINDFKIIIDTLKVLFQARGL